MNLVSKIIDSHTKGTDKNKEKKKKTLVETVLFCEIRTMLSINVIRKLPIDVIGQKFARI